MKDAQSLENSVSQNFDGKSLLMHVEDINSRSTLYSAFILTLDYLIYDPCFTGMLSELDVDVNEGSLMELQGHIGRFQVTDLFLEIVVLRCCPID